MDDNEFTDTLAEKATELFKLCDHKQKGYIIEDDLVLVTEELGLPLSREQISLTFNKLDKDQNNYLTLAEFISGFGLFLGDAESDDSLPNFHPSEYSQGHKLFDFCDRERKGYIVKSDVERLSEEFELTQHELGDLFHSLDKDGNGYLTLEEFVAGFGQFLAYEENKYEVSSDDDEANHNKTELVYESFAESTVHSPGLSEDAIFESIASKVGDDLLSGVLSKGKLQELWKALSSNEVVGFEKLTDFLTEVSQEIKRSRTQAVNVEKTLKGKVEAHEIEIQKLYDKMDKQLNTEKQDISSQHEKREKEICEQFQNEMEMKEQELQEMLKQQKELEKKIKSFNKADVEVRNENNRLLETNDYLQSKLDESTGNLEDTKSYVQQLQSKTIEERKENKRTATTIAQGMQKEHESLIRQLDMLREVNQKLRDQKDAIQAVHEASLERSPAKTHKTVSRQGSEMSKYFAAFDGGRKGQSTSLSSVGEYGEYNVIRAKPKLQRTKVSTQSLGRENSLIEYANEADGAEFESDRVFEDGELKEGERPLRMQKIDGVKEQIMSEAEKRKTENQFRVQKMNITPEVSLQNGRFKMAQNESFEQPLSPRKPPVGIETENTTLSAVDTHLQRVYKVVFVGDSGVGKSSFIHRYCYEIWKPSYTATIGLDFQVKSLEIDRKKIALQLWDTAGQERFRSITKQYFRKADAVVLLYDVTSVMSFVDIKSWMASVEESAEPDCTVMLVGNKLDLCHEEKMPRVAEFEEAKKVAEDYGILYGEASAKTGENVNALMATLARVLQEREDWQLHSVLNLKLEDDKKTKKSCCNR